MVEEYTLNRFEEFGFARLGPVLTEPDAARLFRYSLDLAERDLLGGQRIKVDIQDGRRVNLQIKRPEEIFPEFRVRGLDRLLLDIARQALGDAARSVGSSELIIRPPVMGRATPWHQDEGFMDPAFRYHRATVWIALGDVDERTGCLEVVPGSHDGPLHPHVVSPSARALTTPHPTDLVSNPLRAGEATIHHCRTMHRVGPNVGDRYRVAYLHRFELPSILW